nr:cellulase family glycosylhydrolase [Ardenticatena sp.]
MRRFLFRLTIGIALIFIASSHLPLRANTPPTQFLPLAMKKWPPTAGLWGAEIGRNGMTPEVLAYAEQAHIRRVRYNNLRWDHIEATRGTYDETFLASLDEDLRSLASVPGMQTTVVIFGTPLWAQAYPYAYCGPIRDDALDDFARFVRDMVNRYKGAPYHINSWEIWNEPDGPTNVDPSSQSVEWGCFGDYTKTEPYFGAERYVKVLKTAYSAIKSADPDAEVVLGGLLLGCNPVEQLPPNDPWCPEAGTFFEGILAYGGGAFFDTLAYHAYTTWDGTNTDWDLNQPVWQSFGGSTLGKLAFLQETMAAYNVRGKRIIMNEGSLLCDETQTNCLTPEREQAQAVYAVRLYTRAWAHGIDAVYWYTLNGAGWRYGGLLPSNTPTQAYLAIQQMSQQLYEGAFVADLSVAPVEAYRFRTAEGSFVDIVWRTEDGAPVEWPLPANTVQVLDMLGTPLTPSGDRIEVSFTPLYIIHQ